MIKSQLLTPSSSFGSHLSMDKYQDLFTLPASWKGALETQRYSFNTIEMMIGCRMGRYMAAGIALDSRVKVGQIGVRKI